MSDGGNGLGNALLESVAGLGADDIEFILDFYHVSEHLEEFGKTGGWHVLGAMPASRSRAGRAGMPGVGMDLNGGVCCRPWPPANPSGVENANNLNFPGADHPSRSIQAPGKGLIVSSTTQSSRTLFQPALERHASSTRQWLRSVNPPVMLLIMALCQLRALYRSEPVLWTDYWSRAPAA